MKGHWTHGMSHLPIYNTWKTMVNRCHLETSIGYKDYGAKGIRVCEKWRVFTNFVEDMGHRPSSLHTIERRDNTGDYCPENCVWATMKQQANNRSSNRRITYRGETQTLAQWCERLQIGRTKLTKRLDDCDNNAELAFANPYKKAQ
jgi:hypothetical protein